MVTIRDVAKIANVSVGTVSRYLNGTLKIREDTAARIDEAIRKTNFSPNKNAASIKTKSSMTVALVIPSMKNITFAEIGESIHDVLAEKDYSLVTYTTSDLLDLEKDACKRIRENRADGAIFITEPYGNKDMSHIDLLEKSNIKTVMINRYYKENGYTNISTDFHTGVKETIRHLNDRGYKRIGLILGWPDQDQSVVYINGYREALAEFGVDYDDQLVKYCYYKEDLTQGAMMDLLNAGCDAVLTISDRAALIALDLLEEQGIAVPGDVALVSSGNTEFSKLIKMTSLDIRGSKLGEHAARTLLAKIEGESYANYLTLEPGIVVRQTT